jgi:hypothetical protein
MIFINYIFYHIFITYFLVTIIKVRKGKRKTKKQK